MYSEKRREVADEFATFFQIFKGGIVKTVEKRYKSTTPPVGFHALFIVHEKGSCTMSEITKELRCSKQQSTQIIDKLVQSELVFRRSDDTDRRKVLIMLTEKGKSFISEARNVFSEAVIELLGNLPDKEIDEIANALRIMNIHFKKLALTLDKL